MLWLALMLVAILVAFFLPLAARRRGLRCAGAYGLVLPALLLVAARFASQSSLGNGSDVDAQILLVVAAILALGPALAGALVAYLVGLRSRSGCAR
jgi:hypothetical protein